MFITTLIAQSSQPTILLPEGAANYTLDTAFQIGLNILNILIFFAGIAATIVIIVGALYYIAGGISGGKDDQAAKGKGMIYWAVFGLIVVLLSRVIVNQLFSFIQPSTNPNLDNPTSIETNNQPNETP